MEPTAKCLQADLGHDQEDHVTNHGSMERTQWFIDGDTDAFVSIDDRKYATGDSGGPMLCSMYCMARGRHVHVSDCRADDPNDCQDAELEHIHGHNPLRPMDWISHRLFWKRSGKPQHSPNVPSLLVVQVSLVRCK